MAQKTIQKTIYYKSNFGSFLSYVQTLNHSELVNSSCFIFLFDPKHNNITRAKDNLDRIASMSKEKNPQ